MLFEDSEVMNIYHQAVGQFIKICSIGSLKFIKGFSTATVRLNEDILKYLATLGIESEIFNILIGTYDEFQKIIIQILCNGSIYYSPDHYLTFIRLID